MKRPTKPKPFNVRKEWRPDVVSVDQGSKDLDPGSKYKLGQPYLIDGRPFIWTDLDSQFVRTIYNKKPVPRNVIRDYIRDGMNEGESEDFNHF